MPNNPIVPARNIRMNRNSLTAAAILIAGRTKLEIAVNETTMTIAADTIPACTAA
ncbi:hypothetical protein D3C73_1549290 [compost metagenome]